ncbi:formate dehydrogenase accessory sulfurtransferase FdhD [Pseudomonas sp. GD04087]|uniref:formate dehydrogenase accessory sulfurtransferase FdhD n=1 Tax=Pseudomonas TaxID=286 RepID=UPI001F3C4DD4|nr:MULTISPECIES: formate dehydrogenase accessory sulfurtransferase FdhD [Pseudomonas]MCP1648777.1 FdhD protein [Pseudomonas nitroreducens]MCP1687351.1 FdhD protein [Pseudomonas nitroreducens]MDH0292724.1 formate dehydrogenase accessory sulfurtransferase FdhD [Pseudomonas sp. GD04087]MDH1052068.1 formate dehydrogenase accessory sulfurtransferase FdhD [Pseudomonas sp. GD03903]MDH2002337.1 formate dehydrogenase accessory sulfurtransferase FdhD [Pseudomonas sp. GD03691]
MPCLITRPASAAVRDAVVPADGYSYAELTLAGDTGSAVLAGEIALAIAYNGLSQAVMMVSPNDLEDFVHGFSLGAGLIDSIDDIYDVSLTTHGDAMAAEVQVSNRAFWALKDQRRQLAGNTGCGLCGVEALDQALPDLPVLAPAPLPPAAHLEHLRERVNAVQEIGRRSGALHAALFVDAAGEIRLCREDIGRHNALDKLIGALKRQRLDLAGGFAVVTSRCSLELIHKAVRAGLSTLVSLSAPTALTVQWAREHNLNLIHLPHRSAPRVYSPAPPAA